MSFASSRCSSDRPPSVGGRGGIGASVEWTNESKRKLRAIERIDGSMFRRARGRAANAAKRALFGLIKSPSRTHTRSGEWLGVEPRAKRDRFTVMLHGGKRSQVFGRFASDSRYTVAYMVGDRQVIGWVDRLHGFMSALQDSEKRDFTEGEKKHFHSVLDGKKYKLPASYVRPERAVVDPFAARLVQLYPEWTVKNFDKMLEQAISR